MEPTLFPVLQFTASLMLSFIFPSIFIGLAWYLLTIETLSVRTGKKVYSHIAQYFSRLLAVTYVMGLATLVIVKLYPDPTGINYLEFIVSVFGSALTHKIGLALVMQSAALCLYLFGHKYFTKIATWFIALSMTASSSLWLFWVIAANSWLQTPSGYAIANGKIVIVNFWAAIFNVSTLPRYFHSLISCWVAGAFVVLGVCAYLILKKKALNLAKPAMKSAMLMALVGSVLVAFPFGHEHTRQVARTQPEKFAAIQGLYTSQSEAPLVLFAYPTNHPPALKSPIRIPGLLSWMAFGNPQVTIRGVSEFPADHVPPLWLTFVAFQNMVVLGVLFIAVTLWGTWHLLRNKIWGQKKFLMLLVFLMPFPHFAIQLGWLAAEVGRQPWLVYSLLRTQEVFIQSSASAATFFSILPYILIYLSLAAIYLFLMGREINRLPKKF
jgi:cytochrome d ubiquinol oxidase subunit I